MKWTALVGFAGVVLAIGCGSRIVDDGASSSSTSSAGSGGSGGTESVETAQICKQQHVVTYDGTEVMLCDQIFDAAPLIHLPFYADYVDYMMIDCGDSEDPTTSWNDRHGVQHGGLDKFAPDSYCAQPGIAAISGQMIYQVKVDMDLNVVSARRWAMVDQSNIYRGVAGTSTIGSISGRVEGMPPALYSEQPELAVYLVFGQPEVVTPKDDGTSTYSVSAEIGNLTADVKVPDQDLCLPSLASEDSPFVGKTNQLRLEWSGKFGDTYAECIVDGKSLGRAMDGGIVSTIPEIFRGEFPNGSSFEAYQSDGGPPNTVPTVYVGDIWPLVDPSCPEK